MISKQNAEHYQWGDVCDGWYLLKRQDMMVIHESMPPGSREKRHTHTVSRQFFFVTEGELTLEIEGKRHLLYAQQGIEIPPEAKHQASNEADKPVEFLVISHPSTRGDRTDLPE